ncbi:hypothetical protein JR316_0008976 [Psilocybe cubensis]|uniref:Nephrocystin 3-like N-terminal domain-containing protein n=2 Tax=Psilocybe cubensis TaxID=181762 RepID=A0A8H7XYR5_PSICU|nr:hypothetical protein JR316_0008976 [Psilocybe cubensis]KAH9478521.1 hypothetical protein JR316_0008976 [Psilocybe cubensis]
MSALVSSIEPKASYQSLTGFTPIELLQDATSSNAFHNAGERRDPPRCHRNTRVAILEKILLWIRKCTPLNQERVVLWIYGPAGAGKSAIAQTIADFCFYHKLLLAGFFFARSDPTRNHSRSLIPTLSYQIAEHFPDVRDCILRNIELDPLIFTRSLEAQLHSLILEPLRPLVQSGYFATENSRRVIVIDGLDECIRRDEQVRILDALSCALQNFNLPLLLLFCCRPEHDIQASFRSGYLHRITTSLPLDDDYQAYVDIERYLCDHFANLRRTHPFRDHIPLNWPSKEVIGQLVAKSSGQFIYAATVVKFVSCRRHRPTSQLDIVLGIRAANSALPFAELDALYMHILSSLDNPNPALQILAFQILSKSKQVEIIDHVGHMEKILCMNTGDADVALCDLGSILKLTNHGTDTGTQDRRLHIFHASIEDFLLDEARSGIFHIDAPSKHAEFAILYMQHFSRTSEVLQLGGLFYINSHIKESLPLPSLRAEILKFTESVLVPDIPKNRQYHALYINNDLLGFLETILQSKFEDAAALHESVRVQLNLCDEEASFLDTLFVGL